MIAFCDQEISANNNQANDPEFDNKGVNNLLYVNSIASYPVTF